MKRESISNNETLSDKAFHKSFVILILNILFCMGMLGSTTYAWFCGSVSSNTNLIEGGSFDLSILVTENDVSNARASEIAMERGSDGTWRCTVQKTGIYTVTLSMSTDSTAKKGFCDLSINGQIAMQTALISKDPQLGVEPFTFTIKIEEANTVLLFTPKWGIPASPRIHPGDKVVTSFLLEGEEQK